MATGTQDEQKHLSMFTWYGDPDPLCPDCGSEDLRGVPGRDGSSCRNCGKHSSEAELARAVIAWLREHR